MNRRRRRFLHLQLALLVAMIAPALLRSIGGGAEWVTYAVLGLYACLVVVLAWSMVRDRWTRWQPPAGLTLERRPTEVPVVSDHPSLRGRGIRNLVSGDGWQAFEQAGGVSRGRWVVVVPLGRHAGRWRAEPVRSDRTSIRGSALPFADRYLAISAPPQVKKILARFDEELDLECDGDVLIARYPTMGPSGLERWRREDLPVLLKLRDAIAPLPVDGESRPAIESGTRFHEAGRNVWQPGGQTDAAAVEFPVLRPHD